MDADDDGLIEIHDLTMLHNMRHDLEGFSYKSSADAAGITSGCGSGTCNGYELVSDLDFDKDGDGRTWSGDSTNGYTLDEGDSQAPYFITANGGWEPIGTQGDPFRTNLEGNGFVIRNLAIRRDQVLIGLFGELQGTVRNLGLEQALADYSGNGNEGDAENIGTLAGRIVAGAVIACHASGAADGGGGNNNSVGGLVGSLRFGGSTISASYANSSVHTGGGAGNSVGGLVGAQTSSNSTVIASYATGTVNGVGGRDSVGGLVGQQSGTITASYATGDVNGGRGGNDKVGGLVGQQSSGRITASYATGSVSGGAGASDDVGGLVGQQQGGTLTASYATGSVNGGDGASDDVGGLVGQQQGGTLTASYATGSVNGGDGASDNVGSLVGTQQEDGDGVITASYGFGTPTGETVRDEAMPPVPTAAALTLANTDDTTTTGVVEWNAAGSNTLGIWDFGDGNQPPALLYNDYDGDSGTNYCGTTVDDRGLFVRANIQCGTLIPGQRATTTPRFSTYTDAIQLAEGDLATRVTANILLPATFTVGGTPLELMWSVHHDPEDTANKVTVGTGNILQVDASSRTSTRRVILRATTTDADDATTTVNDYYVRITRGSGGLQNPGLRFTETVDALVLPSDTTTHDFGATSDSGGAISYQVSDPTLASIDASGQLTATAIGTVEVTARVAASGTWRGATTTHRLAILSPANLALTPSTLVDTLTVGDTHDFAATHLGTGAITWSITNPDNADSVRATIDPASGRLTAPQHGYRQGHRYRGGNGDPRRCHHQPHPDPPPLPQPHLQHNRKHPAGRDDVRL